MVDKQVLSDVTSNQTTDLKSLLSKIRSGSRIFVHGQAAVPYELLEGVMQHTCEIEALEFVHLHMEGVPAHFKSEYRSRVRINNLFVSPSLRSNVDGDRVDYTPIFLSEIPSLFKSSGFAIDVALIQVSPPDRFGYCTLGVGVDVARAAVDSAKVVIAQINSHMPRTHGDSLIHRSRIHHFTQSNVPLPEIVQPQHFSPELIALGQNVASLVEEGSTLQVGIGGVPDAVLKALEGHRHLGVHTEMFADGVVDLIESGAIDNSKKRVHPGKTVGCFVLGSKRVYDFIDQNPSVALYPSDYVNSPAVIARNPKVVAINSAVEVDLTGQVCSDSVGHRMISGVGGQIDFIRGAAMSQGGKPIIAITSRARNGSSRIVPTLKQGAGVVTTRADVHYVVTEYGVADLFGQSLGQRAQKLISIAHPDDREVLSAAWHRYFKQES